MDFKDLDWKRLNEIFENGTKEDLNMFLTDNDCEIRDGKIYAKDEKVLDDAIEYWDKRQLVRKINLNSLYGAILNEGCRFNDRRIGQSTTLTGRIIVKHMAALINEIIAGEYDHVGKSIIYGDTDSCYFSAWPLIKEEVADGNMEWSPEIAIDLYNNIADQVNLSFPGFMETATHAPRARGQIIKCGREIVATKGLFIKKKRYAVMMIDKDNKRLDIKGKPGKVKAMGLDLKRSDTPKVVQDFLADILADVLVSATKDEIVTQIREFKTKFVELPPWEKGTPKRVNKLTHYTEFHATGKKGMIPGHVMAAINWNKLRRMHSDNYSRQIMDGMKTIVCKLKPNAMGINSVAYPIDELNIPDWFKLLPFDDDEMESRIVDKKVNNLLGVLDWDLSAETNVKSTFNSLFSFN